MSLRSQEIAGVFNRWLQRYTPPQGIKDNPQAMQDEADALVRVLLRFAPQSDYVPWINRALDQVEYQMKTRAWPHKGELGAVCSNLRKEGTGETHGAILPPDTYEIHAGRMSRGEAVGDAWVYGEKGDALLDRGLITTATLLAYRRGYYHQLAAVYGHETAAKREAELMEWTRFKHLRRAA